MNNCEKQVRKFYSAIWDAQNKCEIPNVLRDSFTFRGSLGQTKTGHAGFTEYVDMVHASLSQYRCNIEELVIEEPKVFARMTFTGLHTAEFMGFAATGKRVSWAGAALFTFDGDKVADLWVLGDLINLTDQLGSGQLKL